jgi:hypothetical protein
MNHLRSHIDFVVVVELYMRTSLESKEGKTKRLVLGVSAKERSGFAR